MVRNRRTGRRVGERVELADDSLTRLVGLLGRKSLGPGEGLWISPSSGVHTFGMLFPIDVLGLDAQMRVVRLWPDVKPYRIPGLSHKVKCVIELAVGEIMRREVMVGDWLELQPSSPTG